MKRTNGTESPVFRKSISVVLLGMFLTGSPFTGFDPVAVQAATTASAKQSAQIIKTTTSTMAVTNPKVAAAKKTSAPKPAASAKPISVAGTNGTVKTPQGIVFSWAGGYEMPGENGNILRFSLKISNQSKTDLDLMNYWVKLTSKGGSSFAVQLMPQDRGKSRVGKGLNDSLTFFATVPSHLGWSQLQVQLIRWDFGKTYFQSALGVLKPFGPLQTKLVPVSAYGSLEMSGISVRNRLTKWTLQATEGNTRTATLEWELENMGIRAIELPGYSYVLRTAAGLYYPLTAAQQESNLLNPQSPKTISLTGSVPLTLPIQGLQLWITQQISAGSGSSLSQQVTVPVQVMACPEPAGNQVDPVKLLVPSGQAGDWTWNHQLIRMTAGSLTTKSSGPSSTVQTSWTFEHRGTSDLPNPEFTMVLRNKDGLQFPLNVLPDTEPADKNWLPLTKKTFKGKVIVPTGIDWNASQLWVYATATKDAKGNPLPPTMMFALPLPVNEQPQSTAVLQIGAGQTWTDPAPEIGLRYQIIDWFRLPWDETDQIVLQVKWSHNAGKTLPLSSLTPQIWLDDLVKLDAKWINLNNYSGVSPGTGITMYVMAKMPYTQNVQQVQLRLLDKGNELVRMNTSATSSPVKEYPAGQLHTIDQAGKRLAWKPEQTRIFQTDTQTILVTWLSASSLESRYMTPTRPVLYYRMPNGVLYPARLSDYPLSGGKFLPNGNAIVTASAVIPKTASPGAMTLWFGEGLTDDKPSVQEGATDGWLNVVSWKIQPETAIQTNLQNLNAYPYGFSLKAVQPMFMETAVTLQFEYELSRDPQALYAPEDSRLVIEYATEEGKLLWSEELEPEKSAGAPSDLPLGSKSFMVQRAYTQLPEPVDYFKPIKLNVYYKAKGGKLLLASKTINWITSKLN